MKQGTGVHSSKPKQGFTGKRASLKAVSQMGARVEKPAGPLFTGKGSSSPAKMARGNMGKSGTQGKR
jgi:hypothetical protein